MMGSKWSAEGTLYFLDEYAYRMMGYKWSAAVYKSRTGFLTNVGSMIYKSRTGL